MTSNASSAARRRMWIDDTAVPPTAADSPRDNPQYGVRQVLAVWAAAALPMGALAWLVAPWLANTLDGPSSLARALIIALTLGLIWQFVLVMALVGLEQKSLRWAVVREALWLRAPRRPDGRRMGWGWLVLLPLIVGSAVAGMVPALSTPAGRDMGHFLESESGQEFLSGNWTWLALIVTLGIFNTVLGEELLFRGLLLPRMNGVFGKWDWVANGVLFAAYHLHMPWAIPTALLDTFILAYPSKRYRSAVMGIVVHSAQAVVISVLVLMLVLR